MDEQTSTFLRRPINLTIRKDLLEQAKSLGINMSHAAETGIAVQVKAIREKQWRENNAEFIRRHNERVEKQGTLLTPLWEGDQ